MSDLPSPTTRRLKGRRPSTLRDRQSSIIERLEGRQLFHTTVLDANGDVRGTLETWMPDGGRKIASAATVGKPQASGDATDAFDIDVVFTGGLNATQQAAFTTAANIWERIILGGLADQPAAPSDYGAAVDDIRISASGVAIDGSGDILGQAGPEWLRDDDLLPISGVMEFDTADLADLQADGSLVNVIVHEMGHVLGVGTIWEDKNLLLGAGGSNSRFIGSAALTEYRRMAGNNSLSSVPVENTGGEGTADGHWRETTFANELMTGYLDAGVNPISRITAAQFVDLGYPIVNIDAADLYTRANALPVLGTLSASASSGQTGASFTLSLSSATDNGSVGSVVFYRETNGIAGLQDTDRGNVTGDTRVLVDTSAPYAATVNTTGLAAGAYTFYARAVDNFGLVSAVKSVAYTIVAGPPTPAAPRLFGPHDTGVSGTDNRTRIESPTLVGAAPAGTLVSLYIDDRTTPVATAIADDANDYIFWIDEPLTDGPHTFSVTATVGGVSSTKSSALSVVIDTIAPSVASATFSEMPSQVVRVTFGDAVVGGSLGLLWMTNTTTGEVIDAADGVLTSATSADFTIAGNALTPGTWVARLTGTTDLAGNVRESTGSFLSVVIVPTFAPADFNRSGAVTFDDLLILASNYGLSGRTAAQGDANGDGSVNFDDLLLLAQSFTASAAPAPQTAATAATTPTRKRAASAVL